MNTKLTRLIIVIALALTALSCAACKPDGDPFAGGGCQNGATCLFEAAKDLAK